MNHPYAVWIGDGVTGSLVAPNDAVVSVMDRGFMVGDGVFQTILVTAGGPFAVARHLERLRDSGAVVGIHVPDPNHIRGAVDAVAAAHRIEGADQARLRVTVTGGPGDGSGGALVVTLDAGPRHGEVAHLMTAPWTRNAKSPLTQVKSTSYAENMLALKFARERRADEALFVNSSGELCEGATCNVFCVFGDRIVTPPLESGCLPGVTRELVCTWFQVEEVSVSSADARGADEVFLTSSLRGIQPVRSWDDQMWETVGPTTSRLRESFAKRMLLNRDP